MVFNKKIIFPLFFLMSVCIYAQKKSKKDLFERAEEIKKLMIRKDPDIKEFFETSEGYVIFPSVGKAGFIIGGAFGNGVVFQNGKYIGKATLKQLDIGLLAGGKTYGEVIFFQNEQALDTFKSNKFEFSAQVSATVIDEGVVEKAKFKDDLLVIIVPKKGLMAEASVGGQRFKFEEDLN